MVRNYTVYAHKNKSNGKIYVGITCLKVNQRWENGSGYKSLHFGRAIQKYGWDGFEHIVIQRHLTKTQACRMERVLIATFDLTNPKKGYNVALGGDGGGMKNKHHTEETKEKIRQARKRDGFTPEHRKHISEAIRGRKHPNHKAVRQYSKDGVMLKKWECMSEAAQKLGILKANISECCKNKRPSAGGYVWKFEERGD